MIKRIKLVSLLAALFLCFNSTAQKTKTEGAIFLAANKQRADVATTPSGLQYLVLAKGNGTKPKATDKVKVNYELKSIDGTILQSSTDYGGAMELDVADLIPGWKEGVQLMPLGSKYTFFLPPNLAYGEQGGAGGKIKPNETIVFEVELVAINGITAPPAAANSKPINVQNPVATINAPAQLTYLGEDEMGKKIDGYTSGKKTAGLVTLNGKYYFATPNGNLYQTEGNESSTKIIEKFTPQNFMYLAATEKYIYYARDFGGGLVKDFVRYNPVSEKITGTHFADNTYKQFTVNGNEVPGNAQTVDEVYTSPDRDKIFIRAFTNDLFTVYALNDDSENNLVDNVFSNKLIMSNISTPISTNTEINSLNNEVYFNGRVKPTGTYETSVSIYKPTEANKNRYEFKIGFKLKDKKATIYDRFLRTKNAIYSLIKIEDSTGNYHHDLFFYNGTKITGSKEVLINKADDYNAQVLDGVIYVSYKGAIWAYNEEKSNFKNIYYDETGNESWDYIQKNKRFLKAGNYLLFSKGKKFGIYNLITQKSTALKNPVLANQPNFFTYTKTYAYAGNHSFYFMDNIDGKEVFMQYNPTNNSYTPFVFPEFKKQSFGEIKAIYHNGNKFVFLTNYIGKKDKTEYKMFMYTEGGNESIVAVPEVKPVTKPFDAKLFEQQVNSIIAEPKNGFKNILGEAKSISTNSIPVNASTVAVEGIGDGTIKNYRDSKTLMYNAETNRMFKEEAAALMEIIEKQLQKIKLPFSFTKIVNYDVASRRFISYEFNGKMATIDLDMLRGTDAENVQNWTVTFRVRK